MRIISNKVKCKHCGSVIESMFRHDFVTCTCGKVSVDGGHEYLKRNFSKLDDFTELSVTDRTEEDSKSCEEEVKKVKRKKGSKK